MSARPASGLVVVLLVLLATPAVAQEEFGRVVGRVMAADDPAQMVRVEIRGTGLPSERHAATDVSGYFRLQGLPVGTYQIRLSLVGYRPVVVDSIIVQLGRTTSIGEIRLDAQALELGEIVVVAGRPLIDVASAASVTNLSSEQFSNIPTDRNFRSIVSLAPQANLSFLPNDEVNIAGGTGPENAYFLDGVNITDPYLGSTSSDLPFNFVRELQVKSGGYEAEYGRATGGIINVITHSGGNRFAGQLFGFFTGSDLSASPRFALEGAQEDQFSEYDFGGSLGGPIVRDRAWFFAAYNPSFRRQRVELPGFTLPDDTRAQHLFATKVTWQASSRTDVTVTFHGDPGNHRHLLLNQVRDSLANAEAITEVGKQGGTVLSGLLHQRLGERTELEVGVARFTDRSESEAPTEFGRTAPYFDDLTTGILSGGRGITYRTYSVRMSVRGSLAVALGRHGVKIGAEYEDNRYDEFSDQSGQAGSPGGTLRRLDSSSYEWYLGKADWSIHNRIPTLYAQDSWRVMDRLTLQFGLRWDSQNLTTTSGESAQTFGAEWQPRLGAVYQLGRLGSHKLFGSYGRFYEEAPLLPAVLYYNDANFNVDLLFDHDPRVDPSGADTNYIFQPVAQPSRDLKGQSYDEFTLGYEAAIGRQLRAGVRGMVRRLRWVVDDAFNPETGGYELGNLGRGNLAFTPRARRNYSALVFTLEKPRGRHFAFLASYVLSRSYGNYEGLYDFQQQIAFPNVTSVLDFPEQYANSTGLLPNDRTHVVKFSGSYRFDRGIIVGTAMSWSSGMPRNDLGGTPLGDPFYTFLRQRGSAGRTASLFDADLRVSYLLPSWSHGGIRPKVYLDVFHLGNGRVVLRRDDARFAALDESGNEVANPGYNRAQVFQPPMSARVGMSLDFGEQQ
jgi:hypothetical protein